MCQSNFPASPIQNLVSKLRAVSLLYLLVCFAQSECGWLARQKIFGPRLSCQVMSHAGRYDTVRLGPIERAIQASPQYLHSLYYD